MSGQDELEAYNAAAQEYANGQEQDYERQQAGALEAAEAAIVQERMREALEDAKRFIVNGVELGYIRMPDPDLPDSAHQTLPKILAALSTPRQP